MKHLACGGIVIVRAVFRYRIRLVTVLGGYLTDGRSLPTLNRLTPANRVGTWADADSFQLGHAGAVLACAWLLE